MKNTTLKQLASKFLATRDLNLVDKAEQILKEYNYTTNADIKRFLGISYFCGVNSSQKISKGAKLNYLTLVLYLSASRNAGVDICRFATSVCRKLCLVFSGHALIEERSNKNTIAVSRCVKTWLTVFRRDLADKLINADIIRAQKMAVRKGMEFAVRLNGTSDIDFSNHIEAFPSIQFYDYSKQPDRPTFPNYHITFSFGNILRMKHYKDALRKGQAIAFPVYDIEACLQLAGTYSMDNTDLRFLDIVTTSKRFGLLKVKKTGKSVNNESNGFVLTRDELASVLGGLV
mgnify:FL=1